MRVRAIPRWCGPYQVMWQGGSVLPLLPISREAPLVGNRQNGYLSATNLVHHRIREVFEVIAMRPVVIPGPVACRLGQAVDRLNHGGAERIRGQWAAFEVPEKCRANFSFRIRKDSDCESSHREPRRCFTSDQGRGRTAPERNSSRRRFTSARHASEMLAVSASSRLSSNATATAERSSAGSARTSSKTWSTRAFMGTSLALGGFPHNRSVETDDQGRPHLRCACSLVAAHVRR